MFLALEICENTIRAWKYAGMLIYILKISVGLIVIITSTITVGNVVVKGTPKETQRAILGISLKILAVILLFLVPTIVPAIVELLTNTTKTAGFAACEACLKEPSSNTCNEYISAYDQKEKNEIQKFKEQEIEGSIDTCEMGLSDSPALDFSYKGNGKVRCQLSSKNLKIVEKHINDFNYFTFDSYMNSIGGFKNYTKKLGGIYHDYYGKTWDGETIKDLQEASEYVFGYMLMYGFDYYNGKRPNGGFYCKWGGSCITYDEIRAAEAEGKYDELEIPVGVSDAYYPGTMRYDDDTIFKKISAEKFDEIISTGKNMTTECAYSVNLVYWKAGIFKHGNKEDGTPYFTNAVDIPNQIKYGKVVERLCDLKVGDIIHFFNQPIDHTNPDTWNGWKHVAFVGEVDNENKKIVVYDGGSIIPTGRTYKWTIDASSGKWPAGLYGFPGWSAVRITDLKAN